MHREGLESGANCDRGQRRATGVGARRARDRIAEALKAYQAAAKIDDQYAELEFRIARALWMQGDYAGAKQHFWRARDLDTLRFRADSRINEINRAVASSAGAELVDADEIFSKQSPNGAVGSDLVYEHVHMTAGRELLVGAGDVRTDCQQIADSGRTLIHRGGCSVRNRM